MDIKRTNKYFYIGSEDDPFARADYTIKDGSLYINYVYVSPQMRGQGIAADLVEEIVNVAKSKDIDIVPVCSYAVKYLQK